MLTQPIAAVNSPHPNGALPLRINHINRINHIPQSKIPCIPAKIPPPG